MEQETPTPSTPGKGLGKFSGPQWILSIFSAFLVFFWALPELGHRILFADDYYGMGRTEVFDITKINCGTIETHRVQGRFLGIYPYDAGIMKSCFFNHKTQSYEKITVVISARPPHTFLGDLIEFTDEMDVPGFRNIFLKTVNIGDTK